MQGERTFQLVGQKQCCMKAVICVCSYKCTLEADAKNTGALKDVCQFILPWISMVTFKTAGASALPQAAVWACKAECTMLPLSSCATPPSGWYTCHVMVRAAASWLARATVVPVNHTHRAFDGQNAGKWGGWPGGGGERRGGGRGGGGYDACGRCPNAKCIQSCCRLQK